MSRLRDQLAEAQRRIATLEAAAKSLDGYRELGAKCAALEQERDHLQTQLEDMKQTAEDNYEQGRKRGRQEWLSRAEKIATLEAELQEEIRSHQEYKHCGCEFEPNTKYGYAPPKIECVYHNNIRQEAQRRIATLEKLKVHCPDCGADYAATGIEAGCPCKILQERDRLQAQLNQAMELLERNGITRDDLFPPRQA